MIPAARRLELLFLAALPGLIATALAIFSLSCKHISGLSHFMPALPLIPIFYWGLTHSRDMPYWFVFALGLVTDAVTGLNLGLSSLLYMLFLKLLHMQRRYIHKEGFIVKWMYFAALLAVTDFLGGIAQSFFSPGSVHFGPAFLQWLLTVCFYPVLHKAFDGLDDYIHSRRWQILHGG